MAKGKGPEPVQLDTRWVRTGELPMEGVAPADLHELLPLGVRGHRQIQMERERGRMGFFDLADPDSRAWKDSRKLAAKCWKAGFSDLLVLGIGGSALGAKAIQQALSPETQAGWPSSDKTGGKGKPRARMRVLDNIDPATFLPVVESLDPKRTLVNVVSKSGGTAETTAQFLLVAKRFQAVLGKKWAGHFVFTTDPEQGDLRRLASEAKIETLDVPPSVGGRFSVLSAVGLFPAAVLGVDGAEILAGAYAMRLRCELAEIEKNPAYYYAAAHVVLQKKIGANVSVLLPYGEGLGEFARWHAQLWAESLGKRKTRTGKTVRSGLTPVVALGVTDQHSQLQLYLEGPRDKVVTLFRVEDAGAGPVLPIAPVGKKEEGAAGYLSGHRLGELFAAERDATKAALVRNGVPLFELRIPRLTAHALGELFFFFEVATVFAGELLGVNPLDQPAVEEGKRYAAGLLGRPGYEDLARQIEPFRSADKNFLM